MTRLARRRIQGISELHHPLAAQPGDQGLTVPLDQRLDQGAVIGLRAWRQLPPAGGAAVFLP